MAEQTTTNSIHPQDGNQIVIGENHATITINNYNKTNEKIIESFNEIEKLQAKNASDFINAFVDVAKQFIEIEKNKKQKRKSK